MVKIFNLFRIALSTKKVLRSQTDTERLLAQQALAKMLADAKGLSMKVGQLFADIDGTSAFQTLVESIEPLPLKQMLPVLEDGLGKPAKTVFKRIDEAVAAASLGQVHYAVLKTGEEVAIKIRYPGMAKAVDTELRVAGLFPGIGPVKQWGIDIDAYKTTLRNNMFRELDYASEAQRQHNFAKAVKVEGLNIPYIYQELCSEQVLVQSRASGSMINNIKHWPKHDRVVVGTILLKTLFKSLFKAGEVHADPHSGNVFYDYDDNGRPVVNLLDYGWYSSCFKTQATGSA